jgi:hypothetical protein
MPRTGDRKRSFPFGRFCGMIPMLSDKMKYNKASDKAAFERKKNEFQIGGYARFATAQSCL